MFFLSDDDRFMVKTVSPEEALLMLRTLITWVYVQGGRQHVRVFIGFLHVPRRALRRLPSPGKSGSVFFLSDDDRFMVKTVSHEEALLLLRLLPAYERHCSEHPTTLLTRFYGLHRIKPMARGGAKARARGSHSRTQACPLYLWGQNRLPLMLHHV